MSTTSQVTTFSDVKTCPRCREQKERALFNRCAGSSDGLFAWCRGCQSTYNKTYKRKNKPTPEMVRKANYRKRFGITPAEYSEMLLAQGVRCAICKSPTPGNNVRNFTVDHDHDTGIVRGLLCRPCNMALGLFRDAAETLRAAADYLEARG